MNPIVIRDMFDALVPGYDRFNRLSSLGLDGHWRREAARLLEGGGLVLDVGTGTGDLAKELLASGHEVVGLDISARMVEEARRKLGESGRVRFLVGKSDDLPFEPKSFTGVVSAFVIRNLHHGGVLAPSMREFYRVLRPGGRMVHLELTRPPSGVLRWAHKSYLGVVLPMIGRFSFGKRWPQGYLSKTIRQFPSPKELCQKMRWAGFERVYHYPLNGGIANLFVGERC